MTKIGTRRYLLLLDGKWHDLYLGVGESINVRDAVVTATRVIEDITPDRCGIGELSIERNGTVTPYKACILKMKRISLNA